MLVGHRITLHPPDPWCSQIAAMDFPPATRRPVFGESSWLQVAPGTTTWILYVTETDPAWPFVRDLILVDRSRFGTHFLYNVFTDQELMDATWFRIGALGHHGYPQPQDDWDQVVYSPDGGCMRCGIHGDQVAPFRLRSEPKAHNSDFVQLNGVFGELFVRQKARLALEDAGITGISWLAPVIHKSGAPSVDVRQMVIDRVLSPGLRTDALTSETCDPSHWQLPPGPLYPPRLQTLPFCGRIKYHRMQRGPLQFDAAVLSGAPDLVRTSEWFGSGGEADRTIVCSKRFRDVVLDNKFRGLDFEPVSLVAPT